MTTAITGMCNLRDLGDLPTRDGQRTRTGVLYRGDVPLPGDVRPADVDAWPPGTVLDLRAPAEQRAAPNPLESLGATVHSLPLIGDRERSGAADQRWEAGADIRPWFRASYERWLRQRGDRIAHCVELAAAGRTPVLVHCSAGRDRTGIVVAVLLLAAGVRREDVVGDYRRTEANHVRLMSRLIENRILRDLRNRQLYETALATPEAIEHVVEYLEAHPEGVHGWLHEHGASARAVAAWRARLVG